MFLFNVLFKMTLAERVGVGPGFREWGENRKGTMYIRQIKR